MLKDLDAPFTPPATNETSFERVSHEVTKAFGTGCRELCDPGLCGGPRDGQGVCKLHMLPWGFHGHFKGC